MAGYRWFVAQALAGLESTATYHLSRSGITAFSPVAPIEGRSVRLFPSYLFVELADPQAEAAEVNRTRGVRKLLPIYADEPKPLPVGFVEDLRGRIASGDFERRATEAVRRFVPQEAVMIENGPFAGHEGKFLRYRKGCGIVLGALLGRELELTIPASDLRPLQKSSGGGSRSASDLVAA